MHVVLRCDARPETGIGHLVRSLALADAVRRRGGTVELWGDVSVPLGRALVEEAGCDVLPLPSRDDAVARLRDADVVHVDGYGPDDVPVVEGVLVSAAQDGPFGRRRADVVVDPTFGARPEMVVDPAATMLLGPRFAPLRASVRRARAARARTVDRAAGVLVVLGGTDVARLSPDAARLAADAGAERVTLVTSLDPGALELPVLVRVVPPQHDLPALAADAEVVVSAAGTTVAELACVGVAVALIAVVDNQREGYDRIVAAGLAVGLGGPEDVRGRSTDARAALRDLVVDRSARDRMARAASEAVDGVGADRIVDAWLTARGEGLRVRPAVEADAKLLLNWRNDPLTRRASRSTATVAPQEHGAWLRSVLADATRTLLVVEDPLGPTGTVRLDDLADGRAEVSLTIAPERRGHGLALPTLDAALGYLRARSGAFPTLVASVRARNEASSRVFRRAGFEYRAASEGIVLLERP